MNFRIEQVIDFLGKTKQEYKDNYTGHLKRSSLERTYYKIKNYLSDITITIEEAEIQEFPKDELMVPSAIKLLELKDMKRMNYKIDRAFLLKYGFYNYEINYLLQNGYIEND